MDGNVLLGNVVRYLRILGRTNRQTTKKAMIVEPKPSSWEDFPESAVTADGILTIKADRRDLSCKLHTNVLYAAKIWRSAPSSHCSAQAT